MGATKCSPLVIPIRRSHCRSADPLHLTNETCQWFLGWPLPSTDRSDNSILAIGCCLDHSMSSVRLGHPSPKTGRSQGMAFFSEEISRAGALPDQSTFSSRQRMLSSALREVGSRSSLYNVGFRQAGRNRQINIAECTSQSMQRVVFSKLKDHS